MGAAWSKLMGGSATSSSIFGKSRIHRLLKEFHLFCAWIHWWKIRLSKLKGQNSEVASVQKFRPREESRSWRSTHNVCTLSVEPLALRCVESIRIKLWTLTWPGFRKLHMKAHSRFGHRFCPSGLTVDTVPSNFLCWNVGCWTLDGYCSTSHTVPVRVYHPWILIDWFLISDED